MSGKKSVILIVIVAAMTLLEEFVTDEIFVCRCAQGIYNQIRNCGKIAVVNRNAEVLRALVVWLVMKYFYFLEVPK